METKLADGTVILGSNNFAHWQLLLKAAADRVADGVAKISVFLPDTGQVDSFELVRGERARTLSWPAGRASACPGAWRKPNLHVLADAQTNELVRLELPGQQTTIEMASESVVKLAQKSRAEEVLARHFAQSNVVFDDFLSVTRSEGGDRREGDR